MGAQIASISFFMYIYAKCSNMKIVCDKNIPFIEGAMDDYAEVIYMKGSDIKASDVKDASAIVTRTRTICNKELLEGSSVKLITTATIGYDHIDTGWCAQNGIEWANAPGCNSGSVQQYMASLLIEMSRRFGFDCKEKTLGIVGAGNVGSKVARIAALLGFRIIINDPPRARREGASAFVTLDELIEKSDIITCHVPLIKDGPDCTYHLFDSERISRLRRDQILINTSRGSVVDCNALRQALSQKTILAAALDVWENEPAIDTELMKLLFCGTPHIAGYSIDGKANGTETCVRNIGRFFDLGCKDWTIEMVPIPAQPLEFTIDAQDKHYRQVLQEAILYSYDIMADCKRLTASPETFEQQRSDYPIRREFGAFTVKVENDPTGRCEIFLREAGFQISE